MSALFDIDPLFETIKHRSLLLTSNRRLAAHITSAYTEACSKRGLQVWEQPSVYPIDDWVQHCWQQLINSNSPLTRNKIRLQPLQETLLWERIIRDDEKSILLKPFATAKQAQSAWRTMQLWQQGITDEFYFHPDCNRFAYWSKQFQRQCDQQNYVTQADQTQVIAAAFEENELRPDSEVILVGFQHLPPLYDRLIQSAAQNCQRYQAPEKSIQCQKIACNDAVEELQLAAQWAKQRLEEDVNQRLAIIVPDLAQQRPQIEATLAAVFEPQHLLPDTPRYQLPFNISAGISLGQTPLVLTALNLLELLREEFSYQTLYSLIKSPFIVLGSRTGFDSAVELELFLRDGGWPQFTLAELLSRLVQKPYLKNQYGAFIESLLSAKALQEQCTKKHDLGYWRTIFTSLLRAFNWPSQARRLDSIEYQHFTRWQEALTDFTNLDTSSQRAGQSICGKLSLSEALNLLNRLLTATNFQAQTPQTPIQVLGMLEGSGLHFDAVWLLGLNDHLWPASASPSPFIPVSLQQQQNMPHASPEKELQFSRDLLKGYLQSSPRVIASYSLNSGDEPLRASTLIDDFETIDNQALGLVNVSALHPYYAALSDGEALEKIVDSNGPALNIEAERVAGGSALLKDQAACPFRAFANHRLSARPLSEPSFHLDSAQRGTVLHSALEQLWGSLNNSSTLLEMDKGQLQEEINLAVRFALKPLLAQREDLFGSVYTATETQRLERLLNLWLKVEMARAPFDVVATEKALVVDIAGLPLRVRIDRIDRLNDNSLALIDYKTGFCSAAKWQGDRLEEPQLPLYAITMAGPGDDAEANIQTLAFARINIDQQGFVGISSQDGVAPGIYSIEKSRGWDASLSWMDINQQWQQALESLANEFKNGLAVVEPAQNNTCQFCHLHSLCRIHEINEQPGEAD